MAESGLPAPAPTAAPADSSLAERVATTELASGTGSARRTDSEDVSKRLVNLAISSSESHGTEGPTDPSRDLQGKTPAAAEPVRLDMQSLECPPIINSEAPAAVPGTYAAAFVPTELPPPKAPRKPFEIPSQLVKPGVEMLKVSAKSARRVKPRKLWLEVGSETPDDGELGLEVGVGVVGGQDVRLCWEKGGIGIGFNKRSTSVPLSRIKDLRFGTQGSPYRTSLSISREVEPRWISIIYTLPQSGSRGVLNNAAGYKLLHFIAPSVETVGLWRTALESFKEGRVARALVDHAPEGLAGDTEECTKIVREAEVHQLCARLGVGMGKAEVSAAFKQTAAPRDFLDFAAFQEFVKLLKRRDEVEEIFRSIVGSAGEFSQESWKEFLTDTQKVQVDSDMLDKTYSKYADRDSATVRLDGFSSYLMSSDNAALRDESTQDMSRPLTEYYVSSSHNTYLVGSQIQGDSTVEGYIRALQQGCRCVELDVWDGDDGEPVVTHGMTLTSKIHVREILEAVSRYAFLASPYPVILSVEIHCSLEQQDKLVDIFKSVLGDRLVQQRLDSLDGDIEKLPSPLELKGKFLLKAKNKFVTSANIEGLPIAMAPEEPSSSNESSASSDSDFKKVLKAVRQNVTSRPSIGSSRRSSSSSRSIPLNPSPNAPSFFAQQNNRLTTAPLASSPPPMSYIPAAAPPMAAPVKNQVMSSALLSLLVYTVGVKARGFNKKETYLPTHVISVGESFLSKMTRDEGARQDFVAHNRDHLTRAYPKGSRLTSSNFTPHHMWAAGVQLVALNWQTFDVGMELNAAMFSRAGRSGYVLKPELLRKKGAEKDKAALTRSENYLLELEVISAQQLPRPRGSFSASSDAEMPPVDPFVEVALYQPGAPQPVKMRSKIVSGNSFNPVFKSVFSLPFSCHPSNGMLDLVFLRLEVLNARGRMKEAAEEGKGDFLGAYTISVGALLSGYRHVPLYDSIGDQHLFSTLFIKSSVVPVSADGAKPPQAVKA